MLHIKKIYELLFSSILTPYNLLDNLQLSNYNYINYSKKDDFILADIQCIMDNEIVNFHYYFSLNDNFLQKIIMLRNENENTVYERSIELQKMIIDYQKEKESTPESLAG